MNSHNPPDLPDPTTVLDLIDAFRRSQTMFTAVRLGVFGHLYARESTAAELSAALSAGASALERLLDGCVGLGLLKKQDGRYSNLPVADTYLRPDSPHSLCGYVLYSAAALYPMWGHLDDAVREGTHRWKQTFDLDGPLFSHFFRTEKAMHDFLMGMHGFGLVSSPAVVAAFDLGAFRTLADLGGATGHLALAACERYPKIRAIVFDLPGVIERVRRYAIHSPVVDRVTFVPGDFFQDPLPQADLFALGRVLHDWREEKIRLLLRRIWERLPTGGGVLIVEKLLDDDKTGPLPALMQSLNMLVCTEGKERTLAEYASLLRDAGFAGVRGARTGQPLDAVLALKR